MTCRPFALALSAGMVACLPACGSATSGGGLTAGAQSDAGGDDFAAPAHSVDAALGNGADSPAPMGTAPADDGSISTGPTGDGASGPIASGGDASPVDDGAALLLADAESPDSARGDSGSGVVPGKCPTGMVRINARNQSFIMGADLTDGVFDSPTSGVPWACYVGKHKVTFTYDYCMDATLVTQGDFTKVMGFNPSQHKTVDATLPVDSPTWYDAMLYCNKKSQLDGLQPAYSHGAVTLNGMSASVVAAVTVDITKNGYRLPTNAEYEYAERANTTGRYFFTSAIDKATVTTAALPYAWCNVNSGAGTHPVGTKMPNPWGLYDLVGQLFEWENDWEGPYSTMDQVDPLGPPDGMTGCGPHFLSPINKMTKGGSWLNDPYNHMRIVYHFKWPANTVHHEIGFRCVATSN